MASLVEFRIAQIKLRKELRNNNLPDSFTADNTPGDLWLSVYYPDHGVYFDFDGDSQTFVAYINATFPEATPNYNLFISMSDPGEIVDIIISCILNFHKEKALTL